VLDFEVVYNYLTGIKMTRYKIAEIKAKVLPILKHHDAARAGLFGSIVTGDVNE